LDLQNQQIVYPLEVCNRIVPHHGFVPSRRRSILMVSMDGSYCFLGISLPKGYDKFDVNSRLHERTIESVELGPNVRIEIFLRQLESFEQAGVHNVVGGPCVNQDSTDIEVSHVRMYKQRYG